MYLIRSITYKISANILYKLSNKNYKKSLNNIL